MSKFGVRGKRYGHAQKYPYVKVYTSEDIQHRRVMAIGGHPWIPELVRGADLGKKYSNKVYDYLPRIKNGKSNLGK